MAGAGCAAPDCRWPYQPAGPVCLGSDRSRLRVAGGAPAVRPAWPGGGSGRRLRLSRLPGACTLPAGQRAGPVRGRGAGAGTGADQPGAGATRRCDRQQSAVSPGTRRSAGTGPRVHHRRGRRVVAGWPSAAGGEPAPAVRGHPGAALSRGAHAGDARRLQGDRGNRGTPVKLVKLIANLGYGSRKDVARLFRSGRITDIDGEVLYADDVVPHETIRVDDEPLEPPSGLVLMMNNPLGVTCSRKDPGRVVYDLLPPRYSLRSPAFSTVGRLDRDTSGLLLFTDDGGLLHRIISPKAQVAKVYEATLAQDLCGDRQSCGTLAAHSGGRAGVGRAAGGGVAGAGRGRGGADLHCVALEHQMTGVAHE